MRRSQRRNQLTRRKKVSGAILLVLIAIQFIQVTPNRTHTVSTQNIFAVYEIPDGVTAIFRESCFDCHSNNTQYPWYSRIQPFGWWMATHIREGKAELNFDEYGLYSKRRRISKLKSIYNSVQDGSMPLASYTWMHKEAKLTDDEKDLLLNWTRKVTDSLTSP